jgi:ribokinase
VSEVNIVVTGYASMDYAMRLDSPAAPDRTATILARPREWPRVGGAPAYVASALAASGARGATPISWIGDDSQGLRYREELRLRGVEIEGVRARPGRTPICVLAYQPDGGCLCLYDPGLDPIPALDDGQRALISAADLLCLTVGPEPATREALALARPDARLVWAVKADPRATPPDLASRLAARADIVVHSRGEAAFVAAAGPLRPDALRIETRGADGVAMVHGGEETQVAVEPLETADATGAGDTWLGGFLAAYCVRDETLIAAARSGAERVARLFASRRDSRT